MKRFARILLGFVLVAAAVTLTMVVVLNIAGETSPGLGRIFAFVLTVIPTGTIAIFILLWRSAFGTVIAIAVACMLIGALLGVTALLPPGATMYRGDSLGVGRLLGLIVGAGLLLWGGATWIGASAARGASARYATLLKLVAAMPTLVVVVVVALLVKSSYDSLQPVVALRGVPSTAGRPGSPPPTDRGNATFAAAAFDDTGALLVTTIRELDKNFAPRARIQVWDARDGALIATIDASPPRALSNLLPMLDSGRGRLLAVRNGFVLADLRTGRDVARLPTGAHGPRGWPLTLIGDGNRALFTGNNHSNAWERDPDNRLELWQLDPPQLLRSAPHPVETKSNYEPSWASTSDRSVLAIAYRLERSERPYERLFVVDGATLEARPLALPAGHEGPVRMLAFSPDGRLLAVAGDDSLVVYDRAADAWVVASGFNRGDRSKHIHVSADGQRIVEVDASLTVWVFDTATGARVGRSEPMGSGHYASVAVSRDGNRIVALRPTSDTFELVDSRTADRVGWICPYVCNVRPRSGYVDAAAALSADGRSVAISHPAGAGVWEFDTGRLRFPLRDPMRAPITDGSP